MIAPTLPDVMAGGHPLVRGVLTDDGTWAGVFGAAEVAVPGRGDTARWFGGTILLRRAVCGNAERDVYDPSLTHVSGWNWGTRAKAAALRWRVANGLLYWVDIRDDGNGGQPLPPGSPPLMPDARFRAYPLTKPALDAAVVRGVAPAVAPGQPAGPMLERQVRVGLLGGTVPRADLLPFEGLFTGLFPRDRRLTPSDLWRTHFDVTFDPDGRPELYVNAPGWVSRYNSTLSIAEARPLYRWHLADTYPVRWSGPFHVVADGPDRLFVRADGSVFGLIDGPPGEQASQVYPWNGPAVVALIQDVDKGWYAFTRTHYFHITAKPDPKPHGLKAFPGATAEEALDTVAACGRVIHGLK